MTGSVLRWTTRMGIAGVLVLQLLEDDARFDPVPATDRLARIRNAARRHGTPPDSAR